MANAKTVQPLRGLIAIASLIFFLATIGTADDEPRIELASLGPLVGPVWVGTFPDGTLTDEQRFEWLFGGMFLRGTHQVKKQSGDVVYEGETVYAWDATTSQIVWWYWNTTGGFITGTLEGSGRVWLAEGVNHAAPRQTPRVRSEFRIDDDSWESISYFWRDDAWAERFRMTFHSREADTTAGSVVTDSVDGASLRENLLGDASVREVKIYLPPGYAEQRSRRYPVVYLLHAYGVGNESWLGGEHSYEDLDVGIALNDLIGSEAIDPVIVVLPDAQTHLGGSWYVDSPTTGRWESFVADDLVAHIDERYRTIPGPGGRGIAGQSMGGYGALRIAMHRPDVFGAVLAMSAPNLVNPDPFGAPAHEAALSNADLVSLENASLLARLMWSKAAAFSPNRDSPPLYADLPFERTTEGIARRDAIWEQWLQHTPVREVEPRLENLAALAIALEVGARDPARAESLRLSEELSRHGVVHTFVIFDGAHVEGVRARFEGPAFRFFDSFFNDRN